MSAVALSALLATAFPAGADLGVDPEPITDPVASEGQIVSTTMVGLDSTQDNPITDPNYIGYSPPTNATNTTTQACFRYSSSALTLAFTSGTVLVPGQGTYNVSRATPVVAELRGTTANRLDGPNGSYHDDTPGPTPPGPLVLGVSGDGDDDVLKATPAPPAAQTPPGCLIAEAGTTRLPFDTRAVASVVTGYLGGVVTFVGAADIDRESLRCIGGSASDTLRRGGNPALGGAGDHIELLLKNVQCSLRPANSTVFPPAITMGSDTGGVVTAKAHIRVLVSSPQKVTACSGAAPLTCQLDWAWTDLG